MQRRDAIKIAIAGMTAASLDAQDRAAPSMELTAGPLTLQFDPKLAFVRYVRVGSAEVLRGLYAAVRDQYWNTVLPNVTNIRTRQADGGFELMFDAACEKGDVDFLWKGAITGQKDGTLRFAMDGVAQSTFLRNRIGFCVLHPLKECAGKPVTIETGEGKQDTRFPDEISPHQPFKDLRAMTHEIAPGVRAEVRFEGDIFETEDHRNWTDANFKTYCTPLELPYPVRIEKGTKISQAVTVRLVASANAHMPARLTKGSAVRIESAGAARKLPLVGFGMDATRGPLQNTEVQRLRKLAPAHVRIDLVLHGSTWKDELALASRTAQQLGAKLECALFVDDGASEQLQGAAAALNPAAITRLYVFHAKETSTQGKWVELARKHLPRGLKIGAGTNNYFTELNRQRPPVNLLDTVAYSLNPQVHAFDDASLVENLEGQPPTVATARTFVGDKWLAVTPVTLRPRFNPNGGSKPSDRIDPRQKTAFAAAWTLGSCKHLSEAGADSVTFYELAGPAGLLDGVSVFPLYDVFGHMAEFAGGTVTPMRSSDPLRVDAMLLQNGTKRRLLIVNYTPRPQSAAADGRSLRLKPYEVLVL
jgi:hypothetical protein